MGFGICFSKNETNNNNNKSRLLLLLFLFEFESAPDAVGLTADSRVAGRRGAGGGRGRTPTDSQTHTAAERKPKRSGHAIARVLGGDQIGATDKGNFNQKVLQVHSSGSLFHQSRDRGPRKSR